MWEYRSPFKIENSFSLDIYPEVGFLDHMVVLFLIFLRKPHTAFHTGCTNLYSHQVCTGVSSSEMSNNHFLVFYTYHILSYSFHHCPISVRLVVPLIFIRSLYSVVQQKVQTSGLCHTEQTVPQRSHSAPTVTEGEARACSAPCTRSAPLQV